VKTLKDTNTKAKKDVLLNQILKEIAEENVEVHNDRYLDEIIPLPKTHLSDIRKMQKKRQWFFIVFLMLAIVYVLFDLRKESSVNEKKEVQTTREKATEGLHLQLEGSLNDPFRYIG